MDLSVLSVVQVQPGNYWTFVGVGYGTAAVALGGYVAHLIRRGRRLSRQVAPEKRRWM